MTNISDRHCRENQNTYSMFNDVLFNIVPFMKKKKKILRSRAGHGRQYGGACALHAAIQRLQIWHSEYTILILFSLQQWLQEGASLSCFAYIATLVFDKTYRKFS
jgi:hypothetical protein